MPQVEYRGMLLVVPDNDSEFGGYFEAARQHRLVVKKMRRLRPAALPARLGLPVVHIARLDLAASQRQGHHLLLRNHRPRHPTRLPRFHPLSRHHRRTRRTTRRSHPSGRPAPHCQPRGRRIPARSRGQRRHRQARGRRLPRPVAGVVPAAISSDGRTAGGTGVAVSGLSRETVGLWLRFRPQCAVQPLRRKVISHRLGNHLV